MLTINVTKGKRQRRSKKKFLIPLYIIIPFLAFFSYIYIKDQIPPSTVMGIFLYVPPKAVYETFKVSFDEQIPTKIQDMIKSSVDDIALDGKKRFEFVKRGDYTIKSTQSLEGNMYSKEYIPVGHAYWIKSNISFDDIKGIYVEEKDMDLVKYLVGEKEVISKEDIVSELKKSEEYIGLVSAAEITGEMKVLSVDGVYPLEKQLNTFSFRYVLEGEENMNFVSHILSVNMELKYGESSTLDTQDIAKINMSGVVAISRGLASKMDSLKDYDYPAQSIGEFLADADLTHISNEVSFVEGCAVYSGMRFCSNPKYIDTLKASGVDIVELTGNHNNDFGASNNAKSIEMYKELGWDYFGGGLNTQDASKILYKEVKGSTIAFVGYNYYDTMLGSLAIAGESRAGANSYSVEKLGNDIEEAKKNADVVIVTFQFQECYSYPSSDVIYPICYKPLSSPDQKGVFRKAIDLGADVVIGTQAHQPQTYEVYKEGLIFYGLGNLYFDQYRWIGTRHGLILSLYVKDGKLVQAKLTPTLMERDLIPKIAKESDRDLLLNLLKSARTF